MKRKIMVIALIVMFVSVSLSAYAGNTITRVNGLNEKISSKNCENDYNTNIFSNESFLLRLIHFIHNYPIFMNTLEKIILYTSDNSDPEDETEYWGLLIAVGEYLNHPREDRPQMLVEVEDLYQSLISSRNWEPSHIRKIKGQNATLNNIFKGFIWLSQMVDENDISFIYITTHGAHSLNWDFFPKDEADGRDEYLFPYEGFDDNTKLLWDDEINLFCSILQSKGICLIVDSCHSGGFNDADWMMQTSGLQWQLDFIESMKDEKGRVILMSSAEDELSYGSKFSHYIAEGLEGNADFDENLNISAEEVYAYAEPLVLHYNWQHPTMLDIYDGDLQLVEI